MKELLQRCKSAIGAMLTHMGMDEDTWNKPAFDKCRAALADLDAAIAQQAGPADHIGIAHELWAMAQGRPGEGIDEAALRIAARLAEAYGAQQAEPMAWLTEDADRVITHRQRETALRDGGASASSVRPFCVPLYAAPQPPAQAEPVAEVYTMEALIPGGLVRHHVSLLQPMPAGTKLYAAPQPPAAEPKQYLADDAPYIAERLRELAERDNTPYDQGDLMHQAAQKLDAAQAKIDALILEYCPDEMTPEQVTNWGAHQVPASPAEPASSGRRLDLAKLAGQFKGAPDDVEYCGKPPAEPVSAEGLPPMPEAALRSECWHDGRHHFEFHTADQMRAYALQCIAADRAAQMPQSLGDLAAIEAAHFGDPAKQTGIYAQPLSASMMAPSELQEVQEKEGLVKELMTIVQHDYLSGVSQLDWLRKVEAHARRMVGLL